jgi:hypothetical protein
MSDTGPWRNNEQRWAKQRELVTRMTSITNRAVPNNQRKGVHLRMINQTLSNADNLDSDAVARIISNMYPSPYHSTPIGTNLKQKILDPLVYSVIKSGRKLERPYLILILTDGCPWMEAEDAFRNAVVDCAKFLDRNGYRKDGEPTHSLSLDPGYRTNITSFSRPFLPQYNWNPRRRRMVPGQLRHGPAGSGGAASNCR